MRLYTTISGTDQLSPRDQATLVAQLQFGLREDGDNDTARGEIVMLLNKLRDREDVTYRTRTDVDAILVTIDTPARPGPQPAPETTEAIRRGLSPRWPRTFHARPVGLEDTATTDTTEPRVDTSPPNTTPAEKKAVAPRKSQPQRETTLLPEKPPSPSARRSTKILAGMAVTAFIFIAAAVILISRGDHYRELYKSYRYTGNATMSIGLFIGGSLCIGIAAALIIAMVLVRRKAPSETLSARRGTKILIGIAITAVLLLALGITMASQGAHDNSEVPGLGHTGLVAGTTCIVIAAIIVASLVAVLIVRAIRR